MLQGLWSVESDTYICSTEPVLSLLKFLVDSKKEMIGTIVSASQSDRMKLWMNSVRHWVARHMI
jgi:hypothetical protein